jgi:divinyl protochlorophyllide a 8-vinyl-reductase
LHPSALSGSRIGPNAITRLSDALAEACGTHRRDDVFRAAGLEDYLRATPADMVAEDHVRRLHVALARAAPHEASLIAADAGLRTGDYLLANRIPGAAQAILGRLPVPWAVRLLLAAIGRHAWTFSGSGRFSFVPGRPVMLRIDASPVCADSQAGPSMRHYYAATFERIFTAILRRPVHVTVEDGPPDGCRMALTW